MNALLLGPGVGAAVHRCKLNAAYFDPVEDPRAALPGVPEEDFVCFGAQHVPRMVACPSGGDEIRV